MGRRGGCMSQQGSAGAPLTTWSPEAHRGGQVIQRGRARAHTLTSRVRTWPPSTAGDIVFTLLSFSDSRRPALKDTSTPGRFSGHRL